jgi:hypothetical protein
LTKALQLVDKESNEFEACFYENLSAIYNRLEHFNNALESIKEFYTKLKKGFIL